jgi:hypothetical protein
MCLWGTIAAIAHDHQTGMNPQADNELNTCFWLQPGIVTFARVQDTEPCTYRPLCRRPTRWMRIACVRLALLVI